MITRSWSKNKRTAVRLFLLFPMQYAKLFPQIGHKSASFSQVHTLLWEVMVLYCDKSEEKQIDVESTCSQKHAYLIMAHNNFDQLNILLGLLDDPRNDIYLHIDKKSTGFIRENIKLQHANIFIVDPICVTWGGHSQIDCEMLLFKAAAPGHYLYYHLLSGIDLPLKTQDEIHAFFQANAGKNFLEYDAQANANKRFVVRTQYYHLFQNIIGKRKDLAIAPLKIIKKVCLLIQKALRIRRKEFVPLYKGANWVSITDEMVHYVLSCEQLIKKQFYHSYCADEVFLQSIAMASPLRDTIVKKYYRQIDWERGSPYTYRKEDVPQLLTSPAMFARKFDASVDPEAIALIAAHLSGK